MTRKVYIDELFYAVRRSVKDGIVVSNARVVDEDADRTDFRSCLGYCVRIGNVAFDVPGYDY
jgi:hypothetical protein